MAEEAAVVVEKPFDVAEYIKNRNQAEADARAGKIPAQPVKVEEPEKVAEPEPELDAPVTTRAQRRMQNRLNQELGAERARREAAERELAELRAKPSVPADKAQEQWLLPELEPVRVNFASDAEYNRALMRWDARQEARKELAQRDVVSEGYKEFEQQVAAAKDKYQADIELIPGWEERLKKIQENEEDAPKFVPEQHPGIMGLLSVSDVQAAMIIYLGETPEQMQKLLDLTPLATDSPKTKDRKLGEQVQLFKRLEGRAERLYDKPVTKETPKTEDKPKVASKAERDAAKPRPSESVKVTGGTATDGDIPILLEDGKTLNPAWKARRNQMAGARP